MEEEDQRELQLLPSQNQIPSFPSSSSSSPLFSLRSPDYPEADPYSSPSLDLQLSISVVRPRPRPIQSQLTKPFYAGSVEALKRQAAEQLRLAAVEKAYAERVRELTRREMELAQSEFERARQMWQKAKDEMEKAERMKENAIRNIDSICMEITCESCRQSFKP